MSSKQRSLVSLRKKVKEKVESILEQRHLLAATLDEFVTDSQHAAESLLAITDHSMFMLSFVDVMQTLDRCYNTCFLLTTEAENLIDEAHRASPILDELLSEQDSPMKNQLDDSILKVQLPVQKVEEDCQTPLQDQHSSNINLDEHASKPCSQKQVWNIEPAVTKKETKESDSETLTKKKQPTYMSKTSQPRLDTEVAERFLKSVIRQAQKDQEKKTLLSVGKGKSQEEKDHTRPAPLSEDTPASPSDYQKPSHRHKKDSGDKKQSKTVNAHSENSNHKESKRKSSKSSPQKSTRDPHGPFKSARDPQQSTDNPQKSQSDPRQSISDPPVTNTSQQNNLQLNTNDPKWNVEHSSAEKLDQPIKSESLQESQTLLSSDTCLNINQFNTNIEINKTLSVSSDTHRDTIFRVDKGISMPSTSDGSAHGGTASISHTEDTPYGLGPTLTQAVLASGRQSTTVEVLEPSSPWRFFVRQLSPELDKLMEEIFSYMVKRGEDKNLITNPEKNMICLAKYSQDGLYYRARVTQVYPAQGSEVPVDILYVDYGNREDGTSVHLRQLPQRFTSLPIQAIPCSLAKVGPSNKYNVWTEEDIAAFGLLVVGQRFSCINVCESKEVGFPHLVELYLYVPRPTVSGGQLYIHNTVSSVNIASVLINQGRAREFPLTEQVPILQKIYRPPASNQHASNSSLKQAPNTSVQQASADSSQTTQTTDSSQSAQATEKGKIPRPIKLPRPRVLQKSKSKVKSVKNIVAAATGINIDNAGQDKALFSAQQISKCTSDIISTTSSESLGPGDQTNTDRLGASVPKSGQETKARHSTQYDSASKSDVEAINFKEKMPKEKISKETVNPAQEEAEKMSSNHDISLTKERGAGQDVNSTQDGGTKEKSSNEDMDIFPPLKEKTEGSSNQELDSGTQEVKHEAISQDNDHHVQQKSTEGSLHDVSLAVQEGGKESSSKQQLHPTSEEVTKKTETLNTLSEFHVKDDMKSTNNQSIADFLAELPVADIKIPNLMSDDQLSCISSDHGSTPASVVGDFVPGDLPHRKIDLCSKCLNVMLSHVVSPSHFYVHIVSETIGNTLDKLMKNLNNQFERLPRKRLQKMSKSYTPTVRDMCCAQFSGDDFFYRAVVMAVAPSETINASSDTLVAKVHVFYLDFGDREWLPKRKVFPIPPEFKDTPPLAISCSLAYIKPIASDKEIEWPDNVTQEFRTQIGFETPIQMIVLSGSVSFQMESNPGCDMVDSGVLKVFLVRHIDDEEVCVNMDLIRLGLAMIDSSQNQDLGLPDERTEVELTDWDPMAEDYLSIRNSYNIDVDDPGVATVHYKAQDEKRICKYYSNNSCWRGDRCPYRHVQVTGGVTMDREPVYGGLEEDQMEKLLPDPGTCVAVELSTIMNPGHFYIILPWGKKTLDSLLSGTSLDDDNETLDELVDSMQSHYNSMHFAHKTLVHYAEGEIVAARFVQDGKWYRAKVLQSDDRERDTKVQVFYVDFGNKEWASERNIKPMDPQFLHLPFQAIECFLIDIEPAGYHENFSNESREAFRRMTDGKTLAAYIKSRSWSGCLYIDLFDTSGEEDVNIARSLITKGLAQEPCPHSDTSIASRSTSETSLILLPG